MDAAPRQPREEDSGSSGLSHPYRITVEHANGATREHLFIGVGHQLTLGAVIEAGQEGWPGPRIAIEEIDRHPNEHQPGVALGWPIRTLPPPPRVERDVVVLTSRHPQAARYDPN